MSETYSILDFTNYKEFIKSSLKKTKGYTLLKLAEFSSISPSNISQVLSSDRHITSELAIKIATYLGLDMLEKKYLLTLVQIEKAGTKELADIFRDQLSCLRQEFQDQNEKNNNDKHASIPESKKKEFYSSWSYAGIHLLTAIEGMQNAKSIAKKVNLPIEQVKKTLEFLVSIGFCKKENDNFSFVELKTLISNDDLSLRSQHHKNWRIKALSHIPQYEYPNTFFSAPMCISIEDTLKIKDLITKLISDIDKKVTKSKPEQLVCLNIDWFNF